MRKIVAKLADNLTQHKANTENLHTRRRIFGFAIHWFWLVDIIRQYI